MNASPPHSAPLATPLTPASATGGPVTMADPAPEPVGPVGRALQLWPGTALVGLLALAATFVLTAHGGPQFLYALLLGIAFHHLRAEPRSAPGIEFCSQHLLRFGVGLLGAGITAGQIAELGWATAGIVIAGVVTTIGLALALARALGLRPAQGVLAGGSVAICGASAALAISAVLPRHPDDERFTLMVVVTVTVLSTMAMVVYPLIASGLDLTPELAGLFLGGTIHDVAQVIGAGYTLGQATGDYATVVKLFRVALLTVVVIAVSAAFRRQRQAGAATDAAPAARSALVPWFLWLFIALVVIHSLGAIPTPVQHALGDLSRACLVMAVAALGVKTSIRQLAEAGWTPMLLIIGETVWLAALVLGSILLNR